MTRFTVTLRQHAVEEKYIVVEAEDLDDAMDKAHESLDTEESGEGFMFTCIADRWVHGAEAQVPIPTLEATVERMIAEIISDMGSTHVPYIITDFSDLHDYVDANCYGGFCEDELAGALVDHFGGRDEHEGMPQGMIDYINEAQAAVDAWLKADPSRTEGESK